MEDRREGSAATAGAYVYDFSETTAGADAAAGVAAVVAFADVR